MHSTGIKNADTLIFYCNTSPWALFTVGPSDGRSNERTVRPNSSLLYTPKTCFVDNNHELYVNMPTFLNTNVLKTIKSAFKKKKEWIYRFKEDIYFEHQLCTLKVNFCCSNNKQSCKNRLVICNWYLKSQLTNIIEFPSPRTFPQSKLRRTLMDHYNYRTLFTTKALNRCAITNLYWHFSVWETYQ